MDLVTGFFAIIMTMTFTTVVTCTDTTIYKPFVGCGKIALEIINSTENMLDFGNDGFRREGPLDEVAMRDQKEK